jgi:hypothetical protein
MTADEFPPSDEICHSGRVGTGTGNKGLDRDVGDQGRKADGKRDAESCLSGFCEKEEDRGENKKRHRAVTRNCEKFGQGAKDGVCGLRQFVIKAQDGVVEFRKCGVEPLGKGSQIHGLEFLSCVFLRSFALIGFIIAPFRDFVKNADKLQFIVGMRSRTFLGRKVLELSKELPEKRDKDPNLFPETVWTESGVLRLS